MTYSFPSFSRCSSADTNADTPTTQRTHATDKGRNLSDKITHTQNENAKNHHTKASAAKTKHQDVKKETIQSQQILKSQREENTTADLHNTTPPVSLSSHITVVQMATSSSNPLNVPMLVCSSGGLLFLLLLLFDGGSSSLVSTRYHPTSTITAVAAFTARDINTGRIRRPTTSTTQLFGKRMKYATPSKVVSTTQYIQVEKDGSDAWKTMDIVEIIQDLGGVGVLPTDTGYCFVTSLDSKLGIERLLRIKGLHQCKKSMSLLCSNIQSIDEYCFGIDKLNFKILKKNLPGPYTFILQAKTTLPKQIIFDHKGNKHSWKRQTLGVRMPEDPVLRYLQDELLLGMPLLVSSLPTLKEKYTSDDDDDYDDFDDDDEEDDDWELQRQQLIECNVDPGASWCNDVDFIVDAGSRPYDGSTIYDLTSKSSGPILIREGLGKLELEI